MKFISGKKLSMTQIWSDNRVWAVTPVAAGPCTISQVKTKEKDGYNALQLAYGSRKLKNIKKPQQGHFKASATSPSYVREFRTDTAADFKVGDVVTASTFAVGDIVNVTGISKGRGFQGVVKRHYFSGFRKTHGNKDQLRRSGSIGAKGPAHVFKGTRMPGRMGNARVTVTNLEVVSVDEEKGLILIKGAIPGSINGYVMIQGKGDLQVNLKPAVVEDTVTVSKDQEKTEKTPVKAKDEIAIETKVEVKEETSVETKDELKKEVKKEKVPVEAKAKVKEKAKVDSKPKESVVKDDKSEENQAK